MLYKTLIGRLFAAMQLVLLVACLSPVAQAVEANTSAEITHLLNTLGASGCQFNRNGAWYSASEAQAHLTKKFDYLSDKGLISNAESFIERGATQSSMSGKAYLVKCANAAPVESAVWLDEALRHFRGRVQ